MKPAKKNKKKAVKAVQKPENTTKEPSKYLTRKEISEKTGYKERTISKYAGEIGVKSTKSGKKIMYHWTEQDINRFIDAIKGPNGHKDRRGGDQRKQKNT